MGDIDWGSVVAALQSAARANPLLDAGVSGPLVAQLTFLGQAYDSQYAGALAATDPQTGPYAVWLAAWTTLFEAAAGVVTFTGGSAPAFSTQLAPIAAALATAIGVLQGSPARYGPDAVSAAQGLAGQLNQLAASQPTTVPSTTNAWLFPNGSQLRALLVRATEYTSFLLGA